MKNLLSIIIIYAMMITLGTTSLQSQDMEVNFVLQFNERNMPGGPIISAEDFGRWLANNVQVHVKTEGRVDPGPAFPMDKARLTVFMIGQNGIIDQTSMSMSISERLVPLSRVVRGDELGRFIKTTSQSITRSSSETWMHDLTGHPAPDNWVREVDNLMELQRLALDISHRAGADGGIIATVLMVTPDADRFDLPVSPGMAVFTGKFR